MLTRRLFLASVSAATTLPLTGSAFASPTVRPALKAAPMVPAALDIPTPALAVPKVPVVAHPLVERARAELARLGEVITRQDVVAIADYASASKDRRFHLVDMMTGEVESFLVAHGSGSDPGNSGWLKAFSNRVGSNASCEGAFRTGDYYSGKHGRSMRLVGLDAGNNRAEERAIVVHAASYVSQAMAATAGRVGRSQGCFAFADNDLPKVLDRLGPGRLLLSTKL